MNTVERDQGMAIPYFAASVKTKNLFQLEYYLNCETHWYSVLKELIKDG